MFAVFFLGLIETKWLLALLGFMTAATVGPTWLSKRRAAGQNMPSGYFVHDAKSPWQWARDSHFQILKEMQVDVLVQ